MEKLIEKGWKPFGMWKKRKVFARWDKTVSFSYQDDEWIEFYTYLIRDVVSKENWLWQFVCENKLYNPDNRWYWWKNVTIVWEYPTLDGDENIWYRDYDYYLIESALKDESELEQFLLDNIKIDAI